MTVITAWLFNTKTGRSVLVGVGIALGVLLGWWAFSSHYEKIGYEKCQAEHAAALNKANVEQAKKNADQDRTSAEVGKQASEAGDKTVREVDDSTDKTKERIENVYREPPKDNPAGACVQPLDQRVQDDIDAAVRRANTAGGAV